MIWKHQIYSECSRWTRTIIIWLLAVGIIVAAFYLMIFFKDWNDRLSIQAGINVKCGKTPPTPEEVLDDYEKDVKQR